MCKRAIERLLIFHAHTVVYKKRGGGRLNSGDEDLREKALLRLQQLSESENEQVALKAAIELLARGKAETKQETDSSWMLNAP